MGRTNGGGRVKEEEVAERYDVDEKGVESIVVLPRDGVVDVGGVDNSDDSDANSDSPVAAADPNAGL